MSEVVRHRGDVDNALALAEQARSFSPRHDAVTETWWRRVLGRACVLSGHPRKARRFAVEAVGLADMSDDLLERGEARLDLAEVLVSIDRRAEAREVAREALRLLDRKGATLLAANGRRRFLDLIEANEGGARSAPGPADIRISS